MSIRLIAFDLDGTLTQHKTPLSAKNRAVLDALKNRFRLLMVGPSIGHRLLPLLSCRQSYGLPFSSA